MVSTKTATKLPVTVNCTYDLNGNLLSDGLKGYEYDDANQLVRVTLTNGWRSEFAYDGLGRRRITRDYTWSGAAWTLTNEVRYVWGGMAVLQERDGSEAVKVTYPRGLDLSGTMQGAGGIGGLLARTEASGTSFYHSDAGGNITAMTDSTGNVVARYLYDPYGNLLAKSGVMADVNRYRFSSKEVHLNSGMYYYGYRFYEPNLQRWVNQDPIGEAGGMNLYGFVANNPIGSVDSLGLVEPQCPILFDNSQPEWVRENNAKWDDYFDRKAAYDQFLTDMDPTAPGAYAAWKARYKLFRPDDKPAGGGYIFPEPSVGNLLVLEGGVGAAGRMMRPKPAVPASQAEKALADAAKAAKECPSLEGKAAYLVKDPTTGNAITDIDLIKNGILWEEKSAVFADNAQKWVTKNITKKFDSYMKARALIPGYENAPIGFKFAGSPADDVLKSAIESEITRLKTANPKVQIHLDWGD